MSAKKPAKAKKAAARKPKTAVRTKSVPQHSTKSASRRAAGAAKPVKTGAAKAKTAKPASRSTAGTTSPPQAMAKSNVHKTATEPLPKTPTLAPEPDAEEADGYDSMSLLSGPRDVKPYIPRRGEQYMSAEQLEHFRTILNSWKRDLMEEVDRTMLHMKDEAANFPDPNDRATQESEFSLELRTRDRERKLIRKIDAAIARIDDGTYGYCLETGEEIGIKRLEARPVATLSVEAQERRERREKQYGDREDRYR